MARNWHQEHIDSRTLGERLADKIASGLGSWAFVIYQNLIVVVWMALNVITLHGYGSPHWDPYPFILLNLAFSWQAANTGPVLQMTGNRSAKMMQLQAKADFETNVKAEKEIRELHDKMDLIMKSLKIGQ